MYIKAMRRGPQTPEFYWYYDRPTSRHGRRYLGRQVDYLEGRRRRSPDRQVGVVLSVALALYEVLLLTLWLDQLLSGVQTVVYSLTGCAAAAWYLWANSPGDYDPDQLVSSHNYELSLLRGQLARVELSLAQVADRPDCAVMVDQYLSMIAERRRRRHRAEPNTDWMLTEARQAADRIKECFQSPSGSSSNWGND